MAAEVPMPELAAAVPLPTYSDRPNGEVMANFMILWHVEVVTKMLPSAPLAAMAKANWREADEPTVLAVQAEPPLPRPALMAYGDVMDMR